MAEYNSICRREVMKYTKEWVNLTERIGYWVDTENPYITYDNRYIETLWYLLKEIYKKGLLYIHHLRQPLYRDPLVSPEGDLQEGSAVQGLLHPALFPRRRHRPEHP